MGKIVLLVKKSFNPNEPRDEEGRWTKLIDRAEEITDARADLLEKHIKWARANESKLTQSDHEARHRLEEHHNEAVQHEDWLRHHQQNGRASTEAYHGAPAHIKAFDPSKGIKTGDMVSVHDGGLGSGHYARVVAYHPHESDPEKDTFTLQEPGGQEQVVKCSHVSPIVQKAVSFKTLVKGYEGFDKLKGELARRPGVKNPGALAAAIGRKKYGKKKFDDAAAKGEKLDKATPTPKCPKCKAEFEWGNGKCNRCGSNKPPVFDSPEEKARYEREQGLTKAVDIDALRRVLPELRPMPGYGFLYVNTKTGAVWYDTGDDPDMSRNEFEKRLSRVRGVTSVTLAAEEPHPAGSEWVPVTKSIALKTLDEGWADLEKSFDPNQPRDAQGRWTDEQRAREIQRQDSSKSDVEAMNQAHHERMMAESRRLKRTAIRLCPNCKSGHRLFSGIKGLAHPWHCPTCGKDFDPNDTKVLKYTNEMFPAESADRGTERDIYAGGKR